MRLLLLGVAPARGLDWREPWIHTPSGRRIAALLGVTVDQLLDVVDGDNVYPWCTESGGFNPGDPLAGMLGREIVLERHPDVTPAIICAGRPVAWAVGYAFWQSTPYLTWSLAQLADGRKRLVSVMPHPSGLNRWWNDPDNTRAASEWLRASVAAVSHGETP